MLNVQRTCNSGSCSITYTFTYNNDDVTTNTITELNDRGYLLALVFRQELYKLKPRLYVLVAEVFARNRPADTNLTELRSYANNWTRNTAELNDSNFDPSTLLKIVSQHVYFNRASEEILANIRVAARCVYVARHKYYGHLQGLVLSTDTESLDLLTAALVNAEILFRTLSETVIYGW
jgi:hypothetical protein